MNREECESLRTIEAVEPTVHASEIEAPIGLLLDGYTTERNTFRVYLGHGELVVEILDYQDNIIFSESRESWDVQDLVPNKRIYPENTNFEFVSLLRARGAEFAVLPYDEGRAERFGV